VIQQNGPIWGVALLKGWAIPDAIEIGGKKTRKPPETRTFKICLTIKLYLFQENTFKSTILSFFNFTSHILTDKSENVV